jgi:hypothetical protein
MTSRRLLIGLTLAASALLTACAADSPDRTDATDSQTPAEVAAPCTNPEGGVCVGPLTAGQTYATSRFQPQLSYSVPDGGWSNFEDTPGNFLLVPPGNDLPGVNAATSDFIGTYTSVAASRLVGSGECAIELIPEVPASPQGMADWMRQQPELVVTEPVPTDVGGLSGLMVDVRSQPGAVLPSCTDNGNVVSVFVLFSGKSPSSLDHGVVPDMTMRLYLLDYSGGVLAIELSDIDAAPVTADEMSEVAEQFQFGK